MITMIEKQGDSSISNLIINKRGKTQIIKPIFFSRLGVSKDVSLKEVTRAIHMD